MSYTVRSYCRACGGKLPAPFFRLPDTPLANELPREPAPNQERFPLYLCQCRECSLVQLPVVVDRERLFPADYPYRSGTGEAFRDHIREIAGEIARLKPCGRVLEIASNDGTLLFDLVKRGVNAVGVDPCAEIKTIGTALEHNALRGYWPDTQPEGKFDAIVALNVLAHVDNLVPFVYAVRDKLRDDGVFIFEVGNFRSVQFGGFFDVIYHEHLSYFTPASAQQLLKRCGLRLDRVIRSDSQGGSIRCYASKNEMPAAELDRSHGCEPFESVADERVMVAQRWPARGTTVDIYGAPAKLVTYWHTVIPDGFQSHPRRIYEDARPKVGRYLPGTGIPIVASDMLRRDPPDYIFIAAWNFAEGIMAKCRSMGYRGKFLLPFPFCEVADG